VGSWNVAADMPRRAADLTAAPRWSSTFSASHGGMPECREADGQAPPSDFLEPPVAGFEEGKGRENQQSCANQGHQDRPQVLVV
jgi:hypothetical protein